MGSTNTGDEKSLCSLCIGSTVDARSRKLADEFWDHYRDFTAVHPDKADANLVFYGWVIQKIAGLQVAVLGLEHALNSGQQRRCLIAQYNDRKERRR